ncbi:MAG: hypothetical protein IKB95_08580 [Bacteroidales bacterium]|nr:hypothetical protein [Bacteroidales bacterium]
MKKALLIVCVFVCSVFYVSAQQTSEQVSKVKKSLKSIDWTPHYKGEVNVGYAVTGSKFNWDCEYTDSDGNYEGESGDAMRTVFSRPLIETIHGVEVGPYLFVGAGIGLQYYCGKVKEVKDLFAMTDEIYQKADRWNAVMLPIFANIKFKYPVNDKLAPFLNLGLGGTIGCYSSFNHQTDETINGGHYSDGIKARGGFYCDFGAGLSYKLINFGIGLQHQVFKMVSDGKASYNGEHLNFKYVFKTPINAFYVKVGVNF